MAKLERRVARLNDELEATADHEQLAGWGAELAAAHAELAVLEERWLELAEEQAT